jgi:drug/metabolite transporter (DMT)-like permease
LTGVLWAAVAGITFGFFQSLSSRAVRGLHVYQSTFILLLISTVVLSFASLATEDLSVLSGATVMAYVNFGLAGFFHFVLGWTFISLSQERIGAARTGALVGATPLFATLVALLTFSEFLSLLTMLGIIIVVAGVYLVSTSGLQANESDWIAWRESLFGLGVALFFSISPIFIRVGLEGLPSPLLGVTIGMGLCMIISGILLIFQQRKLPTMTITRDAVIFLLLAGFFVSLSTWFLWIALDNAPVGVVIALGRINVPVILIISPMIMGKALERVTVRVWMGASLVVIGSLVLIFY